MLFDLKPGLGHSKVFEGLNRFLREILLATLEGRAVDQNAMPHGLYVAVIGNRPTKLAVDQLLAAVSALDQGRQKILRDALVQNTDPCAFLGDRDLQLPAIPGSILPHLKALSVHLYERTGKLAGVEAACGECIDDHYVRFRAKAAPGNGNVCCVCGTESLAQLQAGVDDNEQWRGPYDHLLAKDHYPLYGVHPENLVPICPTCNSKAKLTKDVLTKDGNRRLSFSPWSECALSGEIHVSIDDTCVFPRVVINLAGGDANRQEKLDSWDDVYKIRDRVEGEFRALCEKVAEDVSASTEASFLQNLLQRASAKASACRLTPFNYWRAQVYHAVRAMTPGSREALRLAIADATPQSKEIDELFFA